MANHNAQLKLPLTATPRREELLDFSPDQSTPHTYLVTRKELCLQATRLAPSQGCEIVLELGVELKSNTPRVKTCLLCTGGRDMPVLQDTCLIMLGLARVRNIDPEHMITRTSRMIDVAFDDFFDPTGIRKGGVLILIISCHGFRGSDNNVLLQFQTQDGTLVNSRVLQEKIMALPEYCTLEIVVDTCFAENVIPGLRRIAVDPPDTRVTQVPGFVTMHVPPSESYHNIELAPSSVSASTGLDTSFPIAGRLRQASEKEDQSQYKAQVVVWATSTGLGISYTEEHLPQKPGMYSILIGAIFQYLSTNGPNVSRKDVWENVVKVVAQHNAARRQRDLCKPPEVQANLIKENRIQTPILLASTDNSDHVLSGYISSQEERRAKLPKLN
ncbi:unnamed protein product [Rhizoctonia solani]|uniref:Uncharacterized protein n=2 Tax=Rhizoctonia solani TaxID=456999 RepID=A0A8H3HI97_9AGAM|nr:unnamed protein product [Rhizoctonia solani]CAE6518726.1 unnamed protein product [Rhizoctonia solani]